MKVPRKPRRSRGSGYLDGQLLMAMPSMTDKRFQRSVIYMCAHSAEGAMGIVVNQPAGTIDFPDLLVQLEIIREDDQIRLPDDVESDALQKLDAMLAALGEGASAEDIQTGLYDVARPIPRYQDFQAKTATLDRPGVSNEWFNMLYQVLLGEDRGPRFGSFAALYGVSETRALITSAQSGALKAKHEAFLASRKG